MEFLELFVPILVSYATQAGDGALVYCFGWLICSLDSITNIYQTTLNACLWMRGRASRLQLSFPLFSKGKQESDASAYVQLVYFSFYTVWVSFNCTSADVHACFSTG